MHLKRKGGRTNNLAAEHKNHHGSNSNNNKAKTKALFRGLAARLRRKQHQQQPQQQPQQQQKTPESKDAVLPPPVAQKEEEFREPPSDSSRQLDEANARDDGNTREKEVVEEEREPDNKVTTTKDNKKHDSVKEPAEPKKELKSAQLTTLLIDRIKVASCKSDGVASISEEKGASHSVDLPFLPSDKSDGPPKKLKYISCVNVDDDTALSSLDSMVYRRDTTPSVFANVPKIFSFLSVLKEERKEDDYDGDIEEDNGFLSSFVNSCCYDDDFEDTGRRRKGDSVGSRPEESTTSEEVENDGVDTIEASRGHERIARRENISYAYKMIEKAVTKFQDVHLKATSNPCYEEESTTTADDSLLETASKTDKEKVAHKKKETKDEPKPAPAANDTEGSESGASSKGSRLSWMWKGPSILSKRENMENEDIKSEPATESPIEDAIVHSKCEDSAEKDETSEKPVVGDPVKEGGEDSTESSELPSNMAEDPVEPSKRDEPTETDESTEISVIGSHAKEGGEDSTKTNELPGKAEDDTKPATSNRSRPSQESREADTHSKEDGEEGESKDSTSPEAPGEAVVKTEVEEEGKDEVSSRASRSSKPSEGAKKKTNQDGVDDVKSKASVSARGSRKNKATISIGDEDEVGSKASRGSKSSRKSKGKVWPLKKLFGAGDEDEEAGMTDGCKVSPATSMASSSKVPTNKAPLSAGDEDEIASKASQCSKSSRAATKLTLPEDDEIASKGSKKPEDIAAACEERSTVSKASTTKTPTDEATVPTSNEDGVGSKASQGSKFSRTTSKLAVPEGNKEITSKGSKAEFLGVEGEDEATDSTDECEVYSKCSEIPSKPASDNIVESAMCTEEVVEAETKDPDPNNDNKTNDSEGDEDKFMQICICLGSHASDESNAEVKTGKPTVEEDEVKSEAVMCSTDTSKTIHSAREDDIDEVNSKASRLIRASRSIRKCMSRAIETTGDKAVHPVEEEGDEKSTCSRSSKRRSFSLSGKGSREKRNDQNHSADDDGVSSTVSKNSGVISSVIVTTCTQDDSTQADEIETIITITEKKECSTVDENSRASRGSKASRKSKSEASFSDGAKAMTRSREEETTAMPVAPPDGGDEVGSKVSRGSRVSRQSCNKAIPSAVDENQVVMKASRSSREDNHATPLPVASADDEDEDEIKLKLSSSSTLSTLTRTTFVKDGTHSQVLKPAVEGETSSCPAYTESYLLGYLLAQLSHQKQPVSKKKRQGHAEASCLPLPNAGTPLVEIFMDVRKQGAPRLAKGYLTYILKEFSKEARAVDSEALQKGYMEHLSEKPRALPSSEEYAESLTEAGIETEQNASRLPSNSSEPQVHERKPEEYKKAMPQIEKVGLVEDSLALQEIAPESDKVAGESSKSTEQGNGPVMAQKNQKTAALKCAISSFIENADTYTETETELEQKRKARGSKYDILKSPSGRLKASTTLEDILDTNALPSTAKLPFSFKNPSPRGPKARKSQDKKRNGKSCSKSTDYHVGTSESSVRGRCKKNRRKEPFSTGILDCCNCSFFSGGIKEDDVKGELEHLVSAVEQSLAKLRDEDDVSCSYKIDEDDSAMDFSGMDDLIDFLTGGDSFENGSDTDETEETSSRMGYSTASSRRRGRQWRGRPRRRRRERRTAC